MGGLATATEEVVVDASPGGRSGAALCAGAAGNGAGVHILEWTPGRRGGSRSCRSCSRNHCSSVSAGAGRVGRRSGGAVDEMRCDGPGAVAGRERVGRVGAGRSGEGTATAVTKISPQAAWSAGGAAGWIGENSGH